MYRFSLIIMCFLLITACDNRERILEITPDLTEERIAVLGYLISGEKVEIRVAPTLPIGPGTSDLPTVLPGAQAEIIQDGEAWQTLQYLVDTLKHYEFITLPDGTVDTLRTEITGVISTFSSLEPVTLQLGSCYELRVSAPGYPELRSKPLRFEDRTIIGAVDAEPAAAENANRLRFPFVEVRLQLQDTERYGFSFGYFPWYQEEVSFLFPPRAAATYALEVDGSLEEEVLTAHSDVTVNATFVYAPSSCPAGCVLSPDGTLLVIETLNAEILDYRASVLSNSEYLGGFFSPNPYIAHNVTGGYGLFAIIEKDSVVLEK